MTQAELEALCTEWQKRLGLTEWKIEVRLRRHYKMEDHGSWGECTWNAVRRTARISVLDPTDADPDGILPYDPEETLVHELLHLHAATFAGYIDRDSYQYHFLEHAIDAITSALIDLKRAAASGVVCKLTIPLNLDEEDPGTTDPS